MDQPNIPANEAAKKNNDGELSRKTATEASKSCGHLPCGCYEWVSLKDAQPDMPGMYPVAWPEEIGYMDNYTHYVMSIQFWDGSAFFVESDRSKYITHYLPFEIPYCHGDTNDEKSSHAKKSKNTQ